MSFNDDKTRDRNDVDYGNGPELERGLGARDVRRRADDLPAHESQLEAAEQVPGNWRRSDDRIREAVNVALARDHGLDSSDIEVRVSDGDVTLTGTVADKLAKRKAEDIADRVLGVTRVENLLRVRRDGDGMEASPGRRGDREVKRTPEREGSVDPPSPSVRRKRKKPPSSPDTLAD